MTTSPTLPKSRQQLILAVLLLSSLLIWLDNTILTTAFETLSDPVRGLGASPSQLQWATGSYTLVFATLMFTSGALGDRFGHRTVLATGMAVFAGASVWAAYAGDANQLIAARAAMGLGSALIMPAQMAVLMWAFSGPARATAIGISSTSAGVGIAAGPLLAGVLLGRFWWGSIFLVNIPIAVLSLIGIATLVPNFRSPTPRPLDPAGLLLSISGLAFLAYGLIHAGQVASWSSVSVWGSITVGVALLAAFTLVELRHRQPSFDPRLLAQRMFGLGNVALGLLMFAMTAASFYGAFYLQGARSFSALQAGLAFAPTALGAIVGAPLGVQLARRWTLRAVTATALTTAGLAMGCNMFFGLHTPLVINEIAYLIQGLSIGMVIGPVTGGLMSTLPLERAGAGSAVLSTVRQSGSLLGIAVGGTIMSLAYRYAVDGSLSGYPEQVRAQAQISAEQARHAAATIHQPDLVRVANDAFIEAMHVSAAGTMLIALCGALLLAIALRPDRQPVEPVPQDTPVKSSL
ncbi:MFS transporter (plasmid) [Streptomyces sp. NBC_01591]|uniref:MFS transporter n=1 Tax=Streptomyces sp. NBC_01591 TaxID=2975888 RepID=UPI002DD7F0B2|nr:MFS transporter [Streptomyces sp. NBC_01591]WSD74093.1 MFS transporter [Streptomyces sp. NBC_01591]